MKIYRVRLSIADLIVEMKSKFPLEKFTKNDIQVRGLRWFKNFIYRGNKKPQIVIAVEVVSKLPKIKGIKPLFVTRFRNGNESWRLAKKGEDYIYECSLSSKGQIMVANKHFNKVRAFLPKKAKGCVWHYIDIVFDSLQVILINYLALNNLGIFTHSAGVGDYDGKGLLFNGKSESGKTTIARIWYKFSRAEILNDDRIIVRKSDGKFILYTNPWHGEFSDYLNKKPSSAALKKLFFIYPAARNVARVMPPNRAFKYFYPGILPAFWEKKCLNNVVSFSCDLINKVPCFQLGFVDNKRIVNFVRNMD